MDIIYKTIGHDIDQKIINDVYDYCRFKGINY